MLFCDETSQFCLHCIRCLYLSFSFGFLHLKALRLRLDFALYSFVARRRHSAGVVVLVLMVREALVLLVLFKEMILESWQLACGGVRFGGVV